MSFPLYYYSIKLLIHSHSLFSERIMHISYKHDKPSSDWMTVRGCTSEKELITFFANYCTADYCILSEQKRTKADTEAVLF